MSTHSESSAAILVTPSLLRDWPLPAPGEDKYSRGAVLVIGGAR
ncbi:MAG: NAD(P)H-hydrate dehydratase, partial [Paenarthrobacter sp.]